MWEKNGVLLDPNSKNKQRVHSALERAKEKQRAWNYERNIVRLERGILKSIEWVRVEMRVFLCSNNQAMYTHKEIN